MGVQARTRAKEIREAREAERRRAANRTRMISVVGGVIILGLLAAIVISLVNAARKDQSTAIPTLPAGQTAVAPANTTPGGAIVLGQPSAPVRLEVFVDYMCPYCGKFEKANAGELNRLVADGTVRLELYPLAFLDRMSEGSKYSTRTASAVAAVADKAPDKVLAFNQALYEHQPAEGTTGLSDEEIASLARGVGVPTEVVLDFHERRFAPWVTASTAKVLDGGVSGTPTVKINGTVFKGDLYTAGPLTEAILAAKGQ
ncbi:thioredoxin domain-containing protein [Luedemannella flava]|uniref:Thioredoxin domain-containing protein n=1 Tax=Luedemannella flava TaxID=349316 RepID=A0ABN2MAH6_9ACTN